METLKNSYYGRGVLMPDAKNARKDLLEKMDYGKGEVTKRTGDGGIDGLVTTDVLDFTPSARRRSAMPRTTR